jgi:hypothetical protein
MTSRETVETVSSQLTLAAFTRLKPGENEMKPKPMYASKHLIRASFSLSDRRVAD